MIRVLICLPRQDLLFSDEKVLNRLKYFYK